MNRIFVFAFILFATLSIVNAKIKFGKCGGPPGSVWPVLLNVKATPDPIEPGKNVTFEVSGKLDDFDIPQGTYLYVIFASNFYSTNICLDTSCPIKAGTTYSTTVTLTAPKDLPSQYSITIYEEVFAPDVGVPYLCASASVGSSS